MKLTTFNQTNAKTVSRKTPQIAFSRKTGVFRFNIAATELLQLAEGHQVEFAQDDEDKTSWYLAVVKQNGFELRENKGLTFNTTKISELIDKSIIGGMQDNNGHIVIREMPVDYNKKKYWPLDLSQLK